MLNPPTQLLRNVVYKISFFCMRNKTKTEFPYITEPSAEMLNHRQLVDYNDHRQKLINWLANRGKDPEKQEGYASTTVSNYASRIDKFYRWAWEQNGQYILLIDPYLADNYIDQLYLNKMTKKDGKPYSGNHKRKTANAIESLYRWRSIEQNGPEWTCNRQFRRQSGSSVDAFTKEEREILRSVALEYDSIPRYNDLTPAERDRWKAHLAQKLGKKKGNVSPDDWKRINTSWEIPSLVFVSLDTGLRPIGVERMKTSWYDENKGVLIIPNDDLIKDGKSCEIALTERTQQILSRWLVERENYEKYDDTDIVWLNRKRNPYGSATLKYLLMNLCDEGGINTDNRKITWYSIRHSVGTLLASKKNLAFVKEQLRHKSYTSSLQYANPTAEERQSVLEDL